MRRLRGSGGGRGGSNGPARKAAVAEGAVKPDGELPRDLEPGQRRRVAAAMLVDRLVADALEIVEQVDDIARVGRVPAETSEQVGLGLLHAHEHAGPGGKLLGQQLAELPQLHQAGHGIVGEVALSLRSDADQNVVVAGEETEVGAAGFSRGGHGSDTHGGWVRSFPSGRSNVDCVSGVRAAPPASCRAPRVDHLDPAAIDLGRKRRAPLGAARRHAATRPR